MKARVWKAWALCLYWYPKGLPDIYHTRKDAKRAERSSRMRGDGSGTVIRVEVREVRAKTRGRSKRK